MTATVVAVPRRPTRSSIAFHATVEEALAAERANSLGRAGRRLEEAIDTHRLLVEVGAADAGQLDAALQEVTDAAYALIVQRECCGFRQDNMGWIRRHYAVPAAALRRI